MTDNQLSKTMDLLTVIQSIWNGMVALLVGMTGRSFRLWSWTWSCENGLIYIIGHKPIPIVCVYESMYQ